MKVSIDKVQKGLVTFIDNDAINQIEGWKKIGFGAGSALLIKNLPSTIATYKDAPLVKMFGVIDEEGNIDIDALHDALADYFSTEGEYIDVPLLGRTKFTRQDLENLYQYIKGA